MLDLTVILTSHRRIALAESQVAAIRAQTVPARHFWWWGNEPDAASRDRIERLGIDRVVSCSDNAHVHARFALALLASTEYVAVFDDDTIPGPAWFENCLATLERSPGILGTAGVRLVGPGYQGRELWGWHRPTDEIVEVDLVGHAWFLRSRWLRYLFADAPVIGTNGEDIELSARAWRLEGVRTFCPPHAPSDRRAWGSLQGAELGSDSVAASRRPSHLSERDQVVRHEMAAGWRPLYLRQAAAPLTGNSGQATGPRALEPSRDPPTDGDRGDTTGREELCVNPKTIVLSPLSKDRGRGRGVPGLARRAEWGHGESVSDPPWLELVPSCRKLLLLGRAAERQRALFRQRPELAVTAIVTGGRCERSDGGPSDGIHAADLEAALDELDFRDRPFDTIVCDRVLEQAADPRAAVMQLKSWLAPSGTLLVSTRNPRHPSVVDRLIRGHWPFRPQRQGNRDPLRFFTRRELEKLLFRTGFAAISVSAVPSVAGESQESAARELDHARETLAAFAAPSSGEDADEFRAEQLVASARLPGSDPPTSDGGERRPSAARHDERQRDWSSLAARHAWPACRPDAPAPSTAAMGWLADGARQALGAALEDGSPRLVLELGAWLGLSARFMLDTSPRSRVITVDHFRGSPEHHRRPEWSALLPRLHDTFLAANWDYRDRLVPLRMSTFEGLRTVAEHGLAPDVVFFDAEHRDEALSEELALCRELFPDTTMIGDDYDDPEVQRAVDRFAGERRLVVTTCGQQWRAWKLARPAPVPVPAPRRDYGLTSIVIATFNQLPFTRQCLASIRARTDEPYELIVVDNASTDGTVEYLEACGDVRVIRNTENRGFPAAANQGIEASRGQHVLLLNNDVLVTTGWLRRMLAAFDRDPRIGLIGPCSNSVGSSEQQVPVSYRDLANLDGFAWQWGKQHHAELLATDRLIGFCLLIRRAVIDRIGVFDERFGIGNFEDDDYCRRAIQAGYRAVVARDAFIHHFGHQTFRASGFDLNEILQRNQRIFEAKWRAGPPAPTLAPPLAGAGATCRPRLTAEVADGGGLRLVEVTGEEVDRPIRLSLCMIVRDNAGTIRPCLESIRPYVDEMIVVDTGSCDETPQICEQLGATVHHFPWPDCFSTARNESLRHARGEWIFWMDSDDTIPPDGGRELRALADREHPAELMGFVVQVHCPGSADGARQEMTVVDHVKLIRNCPALRFEGRIHEQIVPAIRRAGGEIAWTDLYVVHSGADCSPEAQDRKRARDLRLLERELQEKPDHPFVWFNLGMTYADAGRHAEAAQALTRSLALADPSESQVRKAYALLVGSLTQLERLDEAWAASQQAKRLFPQDAELQFREGIVSHRLGRWADAERAYLDVLANREERHFTSIDRSILGYKARHNLAALYSEQEAWAQAEEQWRMVTSQAPDFLDGWRGLADSLWRQGKLADLQELVEASLDLPRRRPSALVWQSWILQAAGSPAQAAEALREAVRQAGDDPEALRSWCQLMFERGELEVAEEGLKNLISRDPADAAAHHNLGTVYLRTQRYAEAAAACRASLHLRPRYAPTGVHLGYALEQLGDVDQALQAWRDVLTLEPGNPHARASLSRWESLRNPCRTVGIGAMEEASRGETSG